ncbi:MAG TPA: N-acetylmuramoyl-L-alanine amidase family protein, partial [Tissierellaceae bacterium]|nr:N-acetylmuramoyl-L-alanine amidase family protein [Tissierellaceae bacterium]
FTIIMTILVFSTVSFANSDIQIAVNGSSLGVPKVNVMMDGNTLKSEVPSFIMGSRTLVPIRFVAESFGAKVDWENSTRTATINHNGNKVDLSIDSNVVLVNGDRVQLDENSTPKLVTFKELKDSRTMVPVRFVSEVLGYIVDWDKNTYTAKISSPSSIANPVSDEILINNIDLIKSPGGNHSILIKSDKEIRYTTSFLSASNKLVIDIENSKLSNIENFSIPYDMPVMDEIIQRVQYSQFTTDPYTSRLVLTLSENIEPKIEKTDANKSTKIYFKKDIVQEDIVQEDNAQENIIVIDARNRIQSVNVEEVDGREALVIKGPKDPKYNIIKLSNPDRIVIDIMDSALNGENFQSFNYKIGFIEGVRVSQFIPDNNYKSSDKIVRVVLDIKSGQDKLDVSVVSRDDKLIIYPKEDMWKDIGYEYLNNQALFNIKNSSQTEYEVFYDTGKKELHIEIPSSASELPDGVYSINDRLVKEISVDKTRRYTNVKISFKQSIAYSLLSRSGDEMISILASRDSNINPRERTIVIDPGHGGKDSGAVAGKIYEKHITTPVSLLLRDALEQNGYNVIMTREDDRNVGLYDRPIIANNSKADLFISIHANASLKPQVKGLEVLYCPSYERDIKLEDQYPFAQSIHDNILALTNRPGRGIVKRPDLVVLNRTYMEAVLIEIGYMSNPEELEIIITREYQNLVVQGILNGVKEYLGD